MNARFMIRLIVYLLATSTLFAQEPSPDRQDRPHDKISDEVRQVIDDCFTSLNISKPERPQEKRDRNTKPSEEDIAKMKKMESDCQQVKACVTAKGYSAPDRLCRGPGGPGRGERGRPPQGGNGLFSNDDSPARLNSSSGKAQ